MYKIALSRTSILTLISLVFILSLALTWSNTQKLFNRRSVRPTKATTIFDVDEFLRQQAVAQIENCSHCNNSISNVIRSLVKGKKSEDLTLLDKELCLVLLWSYSGKMSSGWPHITEGTVIRRKCQFTYRRELLSNASVVVFNDPDVLTSVPWKHSR